MTTNLTLVVCGAPLASRSAAVAAELVKNGWTVTVVGSPASRQWLDEEAVKQATGRPALFEQRRADHVRGRLVHPAPGGCVAGIEVALTGQRPVRNQVDVLRGVKGFELGTRRRARFHHPHALVETASGELGEEGGVPVLPERMAVGKAVARQPFASHHQDR